MAARRASALLRWWVEAAGAAGCGSLAGFPRQFDSAALPEEELRAVALQHLRRSVLSQRSVETCREWWTGHQGAFANRALEMALVHARWLRDLLTRQLNRCVTVVSVHAFEEVPNASRAKQRRSTLPRKRTSSKQSQAVWPSSSSRCYVQRRPGTRSVMSRPRPNYTPLP